MASTELNIVIPVYNEEGAIANVVGKWTNTFDRLKIDYKIHIYNDGSKDNTLSILQEISKNNPAIIVHDKPNSGHGPTILKGYRENSNSTWLFQIDSDDELGPEAFEELWNNRNNYDFLIGERTERNNPLTRKIISAISRLTISILYGRRVYDVNSPYRLMRCEKYRDYFHKIPENTFAPNVIISGITALKKLRVFKTTVKYNFRTTGEVSIKKIKLLKAAIKSFWQTVIFRIYI
jgi:glycosyltransferase involved in cell wall biosynthesis